LHSVNSTFQIKDSAGNAKPFTVYIRDGRALPVPKVVTSLDISPGQRADLIVSLPTITGTWYQQVTYKTLRNNLPYATVYGKVTF
jgi:FtsP/CotA-like multicopper oxidase with cupredoxin domain